MCKCEYCGRRNKVDAELCGSCGANLPVIEMVLPTFPPKKAFWDYSNPAVPIIVVSADEAKNRFWRMYLDET